MPEKQQDCQKKDSIREKYLIYYDFITETDPFAWDENSYDTEIALYEKYFETHLPRDIFLYTKDGKPIRSWETAKEFGWDFYNQIDKYYICLPKPKPEDYRFKEDEFKPLYFKKYVSCFSIEDTCNLIANEYKKPIKAKPKSIEHLNKLLEQTDIVFVLCDDTHSDKEFYKKAESYRGKTFEDLNKYKQKDLISLNREILETFFPFVPKIDVWRDRLKRKEKLSFYFRLQHEANLKKIDEYESGKSTLKDTAGLKRQKTPRGIKKAYADKKELNEFLSSIKKKYKNKDMSYERIASAAINEMEGRNLFLNKKGRPLYAKSTIKKILSGL